MFSSLRWWSERRAAMWQLTSWRAERCSVCPCSLILLRLPNGAWCGMTLGHDGALKVGGVGSAPCSLPSSSPLAECTISEGNLKSAIHSWCNLSHLASWKSRPTPPATYHCSIAILTYCSVVTGNIRVASSSIYSWMLLTCEIVLAQFASHKMTLTAKDSTKRQQRKNIGLTMLAFSKASNNK